VTLVFADRIPEVLEDYWLGPKGSARVGGWGNPNSYRACLRELAEEGVPAHMIHGECANLYHKATGKWPGRHKGHGLIAAAGHTGAMIALVPSAQDAARLAMPGGEPEEELHVTLCYLGDAVDYDTQERLSLAASIALVFQDQAPMEGDAFALSYFNSGNEEEETALVYGIGGQDMERAHASAGLAAHDMFGPRLPGQHKPWVSHVTAAYTDDLDAHRGLVGNLGRITFDRVRLAFGDQVFDIPLEAPEEPVPVDDDIRIEGDEDPVLPAEVDVFAADPAGVVDQAVPVPEAFRPLTDIHAEARRVDVDVAGLVAAMGVYAPVRWHGPLAPIGTPTGDKRIFVPGAIGQATFPQALRWQPTGLPGHDGAVTVAVITHAQEGTWEGAPHIIGEGYFLDPDVIPEVRQALHLVENGVAGPSVDLDSFAAAVGEYQGKPILVVQEGRQRAATLVAIPAFADLRLTLEYPQDNGAANELIEAMVASASAERGHIAHALPFIVEIPEDWAPGPYRADFAATTTNNWDSAPIAPRSSAFDADDAVKRIQAWAGIGTDEADEAKFRSMFLWAKPEQLDRDNVPLGSAGYRLPWGDIFDGKPYLVYHAVYAASALLEGGHGGLPNIPDSDKSKLRNTITKIYARFSEAFDDPNVKASWDAREEASTMEPETFAVRSGGWSSLPTSTGAWDEGAARAALDSWAGDDMGKYAKAFLWFDEANRENRTAYKFPIAKPVDGKLTIFISAVNNAEARLSSASIPAADKAKILGILNGIQERYHSASTGGMETFGARVYDGIHPPRSAFAQKKLPGKTKWTVVPRDGYNEVYGHLADWDTCHMGLQIGNPNVCAKPPRSKRGYKDFHVSTILTAEGDIVEVGKFTIDAYHGSTKRGLTAAQVRTHYEHTGSEAAVGRVYEDEFGPAFFGVQVPDADPALAQKMRRTPASGHWHPIDGHLELVAALGVNRPAFPIVASAADGLVVDESTIILMEDEVQTGLIASAFSSEEQMAGDDEEDCGCGGSKAQELHVARIMAMEPIPTHAELQARQARLSAHLG
jgi:2'-5' RNA ligase